MKFQIVSDLHIEGRYREKRPLLEVIKPSSPYLIVDGDLGRLENFELYFETVKILCGAFEKVILIPGNHEYYATKTPVTMENFEKRLYSLQEKFMNLIVLINSTVEIDGVIIFGSTFWSYCPRQYYPSPNLFTKSFECNAKLVKLTCAQYNKMHLRAVECLENAIEFAQNSGKSLLVVTHYPPTFKGTLAQKHAKNGVKDPKNYLYCSNNDAILENDTIIAWVYGHTGHNGCYGKLVTNQIDRDTGRPNAILSFTPKTPIVKDFPSDPTVKIHKVVKDDNFQKFENNTKFQ